MKLADIKAAAEKKYGATPIELDEETTVKLLNPLRLPKEKRLALEAAQEKIENADNTEATIDAVRELILVVASKQETGQALLDAIGDDLGVLMEVFRTYNESEELGEASASAT